MDELLLSIVRNSGDHFCQGRARRLGKSGVAHAPYFSQTERYGLHLDAVKCLWRQRVVFHQPIPVTALSFDLGSSCP